VKRKVTGLGLYARRCKVLFLHPLNPWTIWALEQGLPTGGKNGYRVLP
jgi:hypothetical protein